MREFGSLDNITILLTLKDTDATGGLESHLSSQGRITQQTEADTVRLCGTLSKVWTWDSMLVLYNPAFCGKKNLQPLHAACYAMAYHVAAEGNPWCECDTGHAPTWQPASEAGRASESGRVNGCRMQTSRAYSDHPSMHGRHKHSWARSHGLASQATSAGPLCCALCWLMQKDSVSHTQGAIGTVQGW
jgi:hypothetical protein